MNSTFLKVLNMSITGSYVIIAVALARQLFKRAPKKYSYILWSVVLFRLVSPVSLNSALSMFNMKPFDMTTAQRGGAALTYVPPGIEYMARPKVTVGIPVANTAISQSLPLATPAASVNPLWVWVSIGTMVWCAGFAAFLIYSIVTYVRLQQSVSTAVLLSGSSLPTGCRLCRVLECDGIRSPFILGFLRPSVYIPFRLNDSERSYILRHEAYHLQRKDHLVKLLAFVVAALHWFNPLVWLAFTLMTRDMEMSCDEKVLSEAGSDIAGDYSRYMLAFAADRRFPAASPLAFGETAIAQRVKNALRFKSPTHQIGLIATAVSVVVLAACAANPPKAVASKTPGDLYGKYEFREQLYMNPLSSFIYGSDYKEYYKLTKDTLTIVSFSGTPRSFPIAFAEPAFEGDAPEESETGIAYAAGKVVNEDAFYEGFIIAEDPPIGALDISQYEVRYQYTLASPSSTGPGWRLYLMDDEIWLARYNRQVYPSDQSTHDVLWSVIRIAAYEGAIPSIFTVGESSKMLSDANALAHEWYVTEYGTAEGGPELLDPAAGDFIGLAINERTVEVIYPLPSKGISIGITFSRDPESNEWEILPEDALKIHDSLIK